MRLTPLSRLAYRCQGGSIEATSGPLSMDAARSELEGLRDLAGRCMTCGDLFRAFIRKGAQPVAEPARTGNGRPGEHGESKVGHGVDPTLSGSRDPQLFERVAA